MLIKSLCKFILEANLHKHYNYLNTFWVFTNTLHFTSFRCLLICGYQMIFTNSHYSKKIRNVAYGFNISGWKSLIGWHILMEKIGTFCKYCVLFARNGGIGSQPLGNLVTVAFTNWKKAKEVYNLFILSYITFFIFCFNFNYKYFRYIEFIPI
jgi:hypothetical protein